MRRRCCGVVFALCCAGSGLSAQANGRLLDAAAPTRWSAGAMPHAARDFSFLLVAGAVLLSVWARITRLGATNRTLLRQSRDVLLFTRLDGVIVDANEAAIATYGWSRQELLGLPLSVICGDSTASEYTARSILDRGGCLLREAVHHRKDGTALTVEVCAILNGSGRQRTVLVVVRDISDRVNKEATGKLLHEIDRWILWGLPLNDILTATSDRLAELHSGAVVRFSLTEENGTVRMAQRTGEGAEGQDWSTAHCDDSDDEQGPTCVAIRTGEVQFRCLVDDASSTPWQDLALKLGFREVVAIPLVARGSRLGALSMLAREGTITPAVIQLLCGFADQVAISVLSAATYSELALQRVALEAAANAIVVTDREGIIRRVNPAFTRLTGHSAEQACGQSLRILKSGSQSDAFYRQMWSTILAGDLWQGELHNRRRDGSIYLEEETIQPVRNERGEITHFVAIKVDITNRRRQEERIQHVAMHDALTDLPNRRLLSETLERVIHQVRRGRNAALMVVDIDHFKTANDILGHAVGDVLLRQVGDLITGALRPGDFVARVGGDEFAILLEDSTSDEALSAADRLKSDFEALRFCYEEHRMGVSASIGVVALTPDSVAEDVLIQAENALHQSKEMGRNRVMLYEAGSDNSARSLEGSRLADDIREALQGEGFELVFQPVVDLVSGVAAHHEVLLRLRKRDGSIEYPERFLQAAERCGLLAQVDAWVVGRVAAILGQRRDLRMFVNLSGQSLIDLALLERIEWLIREHRIQPGHLTFEITEATAVKDIVTAQHWVARLKALGCEFALDDFGVGFSSLSYLRFFAVDFIKIDKSFVKTIHEDATSRALVVAVKNVAQALGKEVIAEGVECAGHAQVLRDVGIGRAQGYYWGIPNGAFELGITPTVV